MIKLVTKMIAHKSDMQVIRKINGLGKRRLFPALTFKCIGLGLGIKDPFKYCQKL